MEVVSIMRIVTYQSLRNIVAESIEDTIEIHRIARKDDDNGYDSPTGPPTDEEVDDFLFHNSLLDRETIEQLSIEPLLGFHATTVKVNDAWLEEFKSKCVEWSNNNSWLAADDSMFMIAGIASPKPDHTVAWHPDKEKYPSGLWESPSYLLIAADLLHENKLLSELGWRQFEKLVGELLESEGWSVVVTRSTKDGGIDVVAERVDQTLGAIKSVWQAKRYGPANKVRLKEVRELAGVLTFQDATKGVMVTTSHLTKDAIKWVQQHQYRLQYHDHDSVARWIKRQLGLID